MARRPRQLARRRPAGLRRLRSCTGSPSASSPACGPGTRVDVAWVVETRGLERARPARTRWPSPPAAAGSVRCSPAPLDDQLSDQAARGAGRRPPLDLEVSEVDALVAGLPSGGGARCLLVPAADLPAELWELLAARRAGRPDHRARRRRGRGHDAGDARDRRLDRGRGRGGRGALRPPGERHRPSPTAASSRPLARPAARDRRLRPRRRRAGRRPPRCSAGRPGPSATRGRPDGLIAALAGLGQAGGGQPRPRAGRPCPRRGAGQRRRLHRRARLAADPAGAGRLAGLPRASPT